MAIAEGIGYSHATVIKLVRSHADKLEQFGPCRFEIQMVDRQQGGGRPVEYAHLTEPQATLLLTFMRNNPVVVQFKIRLVEEFYRMKEQLKHAQAPAQLTRLEILEMAIEAERQAEQARQENTILRLKNED
ncbi:MAG: Rha family transcriptional regulator [Candidatus Thiodiazotropha sp.]